jgi:hypothetical protein
MCQAALAWRGILEKTAVPSIGHSMILVDQAATILPPALGPWILEFLLSKTAALDLSSTMALLAPSAGPTAE